MEVRRVLSIDEIYSKVSRYDLVLTAEASLADALNNRLQSPRVGKLAYTPRGLIYRRFQNRELHSERGLFLEIINNTNLDWKQAAHLLRKVHNYWNETGSLDGALRHLNLDREKAQPVLDIARNTTNIFQEMESFQLSEGRDLCVIGSYQFNGLDRSVLPKNYDEINIFTGAEISLSPFQVYDSASQLVGATVDNILDCDEEGVAVVVHPDSIYNHLLRSSLRQAEINFQVAEKLQDSETLRTLIQLLSLGVRHKRVKLKEVLPVVNKLEMSYSPKREQEYLSMISDSDLREVYNFIRGAGNKTFRWTVESLTDRGFPIEDDVKQTLMDLDLWESPINRENLNSLKYYLDSFAIEKVQSNEGLLLVNPGSVAYIDRPVVFFLGMTTKWDKHVEEAPWQKLEKEREKNVRNFKALVQNGEKKLFMVQNKKMNRNVTPSTYFNEIDPDLSSFTDGQEGEDYVLRKRKPPDASPFEAGYVTRQPPQRKTLSQTELNSLVCCPRDYFFRQLVEQPDQEYFRKGNLFHQFAEFLAVYPEFVENKGLKPFIDLIVTRMEPITDESSIPGLRMEFQLGMKLLRQYFQEKDLANRTSIDIQGYTPTEEVNFFARKFNKQIDRKFTEMHFRNESLGARGKIDLLGKKEITDFKTGRKKAARQVVKDSNVELVDECPDFQALLYLAHHQQVISNSKLTFTFFHPLENPGSVLRDDFVLDDFITTVHYFPWYFSEYLCNDEVFDYANDSNTRAKLLEPLGRKNFKEVIATIDLNAENFCHKETATIYQEEIQELSREYLEIGRGKDLTKRQLEAAANSILKTSFYNLRTQNYFKEDLERFEDFLESALQDLNTWRQSRFPVYDTDLDEVEFRDLILAGDGQ